LTDKYIDVPELMKHVSFEATIPKVLHPQSASHSIFYTPAEEFELHQYRLQKGEETNIESHTAEILLVVDGQVSVALNDQKVELQKGRALLLVAGSRVSVTALASANLFRSTVPAGGKS
jgi:mannose-6-phosphate isomerase